MFLNNAALRMLRLELGEWVVSVSVSGCSTSSDQFCLLSIMRYLLELGEWSTSSLVGVRGKLGCPLILLLELGECKTSSLAGVHSG